MMHSREGEHPDHEALIEAMLLAAGADGRITKIELEAIFARVFERPEFSKLEKDHLRDSVEKAAERVADAPSLEALCESLAARLETARSREIAFRSAASVALADKRADWRELKALRALQDAFGLTDTRVQHLFEQAESDRPPDVAS